MNPSIHAVHTFYIIAKQTDTDVLRKMWVWSQARNFRNIEETGESLD